MTATKIIIAISDKKCGTAAVRAAIKTALKAVHPTARYVSVTGIKASEGRENCGSGRLDVVCAGDIFCAWRDASITYRIGNNRSMWRNYGTPDGTLYAFDLDIIRDLTIYHQEQKRSKS